MNDRGSARGGDENPRGKLPGETDEAYNRRIAAMDAAEAKINKEINKFASMGERGERRSSIGRSAVAQRPIVRVDDDIERIGRNIEDINRAIEAYGRNAAAKDAEIEAQLEMLDRLYTELESIPEELITSDEFKERITTMKVNVFKSIQLAIQKVRKRSRSQVPVSAKLQGLVSDREYSDQELRLFTVASGLIRKFQGIQPVGFDQLGLERQAEIDNFIDTDLDNLMVDYLEDRRDEIAQYREEMPIFKKLCQDLLSQILGMENGIPPEELRRKFLAMVCIIVITQDDGFDANLTLLLSAIGKKEATNVAISTVAIASAAALNPSITSTVTTALSLLSDGLTAGISALGSIPSAVSAAWLTCASIRGLQLRYNEDWMFKRVLGGINDERRQQALDSIFGPRGQVVGWWDIANLLRTLGRYGATLFCGQVEVAQDMAKDFAELPSTFLNGCKKITKAATTKIGDLAKKVIAAKKGEHVNPNLLSRSGDVIDSLLLLPEFQVLASDDSFINHIKKRVNYLDDTKGIRTTHLDVFLARELAMYGPSKAWARLLQNPDSGPTDWTADGDSMNDNPQTAEIREQVMAEPVFDNQLPTPVTDEHGSFVGYREPVAAKPLDITREYGSQLIHNMNLGQMRGLDSGVGPDGRVHESLQDYNPNGERSRRRPRDQEDLSSGQEAQVRPSRRASQKDRGKGKGNGTLGGKRTRHRKATTKKQKSKKNKRQSRRKFRRSFSRKGRK